MKKILLSLLLAGSVQYNFAMQGDFGGGAAQGGAAQSALSKLNKQLIEAANLGNVAAVRALLERGANVNAQTADGWTALMIAAQNGHVEVVKALLDSGANVDAQNVDGWTALMAAAQSGHFEVVRALLAGGADVNVKNEIGAIALMDAAKNGHVEVVKVLLEGGADVNAQEEEGFTALTIAAGKGNVAVARVLLKGKANVNEKTKNGVTALMAAANEGHVEVVKALLAGRANVDAQNVDGWTALIFAANHGHVEVVINLLAGGADVNAQAAQAANGWTALIFAANKGHVEVVRNLLADSADVNLKDSKGKTAIDYATGKKEIIELLKKQMLKPVKGKKASSGSTAFASKAVGGVACAGGGATKNISKTLCTAVAAKILAEAGTQTEPIQVEPSQAVVQKKLSGSLKSAFSKPSLSGKQSSASKMACDEARASGGIVKPIAVRPGATSFAGLQPNIAPHVAALQVFHLQTLIAMARTSGTGLSGLIQLLNDFAANVYFDASESARLVAGLDFDNSFFAATGNTPITGLDLATLLNNSISRILGPVDASSGFTAEQTQQFQILETLFQQLP
jgi:ankyrin repeat protein